LVEPDDYVGGGVFWEILLMIFCYPDAPGISGSTNINELRNCESRTRGRSHRRKSVAETIGPVNGCAAPNLGDENRISTPLSNSSFTILDMSDGIFLVVLSL